MKPRWGPSGLLSKVKWPPEQPAKYMVVGGGDKGGILVRAGEDRTSEPNEVLLATGAEIEQLELKRDRLHYKKLSGEGPEEGWVSLKASGKLLVTRIDAPPAALRPAAKKKMS